MPKIWFYSIFLIISFRMTSYEPTFFSKGLQLASYTIYMVGGSGLRHTIYIIIIIYIYNHLFRAILCANF